MTDIELVQLKIGDTGATKFTVVQIQAFLDMASGSVPEASALALESRAAALSEGLASEKIGDYAYTQKNIDDLLALAARIREAESMTPEIGIAEPDLIGVTEFE